MKPLIGTILFAALACGLRPACFAQEKTAPMVVIEPAASGWQVWIEDQSGKHRFAQFHNRGYRKPILYPVLAAGDVSITRHFPMDESRESEARDHPHHKSIWFAHGAVNGVDFWTEQGVIRNREVSVVDGNGIVADNDWLDGEKKVCEDRTRIRFLADEQCRTIDYSVTLTASAGDLLLADTKEGTFAIRTHPALRLIDRDGQAAGTAVNSEGVAGKAIWGDRARWVHYCGSIDGQTYSVTMMDHPDNLRHPTTWHAREYGLVAANPFGLHYFNGSEKGSGDFTLAAGQSRTFRYAVLIWKGTASDGQINERFERFRQR